VHVDRLMNNMLPADWPHPIERGDVGDALAVLALEESMRRDVEHARGSRVRQALALGATWAEVAAALETSTEEARAEVYERLAIVEEPVAPEHRRRAATQRTLAQDIARDRAPENLPADDGTRQQVYAVYTELTDQERSGSKRAVAALLAERLDSLSEASIRKHLDSVVEAYREKVCANS
jgi:hypothetical protein